MFANSTKDAPNKSPFPTMPTQEELKVAKARFAEMVELPGSGHKLIEAARSLRALYVSMPAAEQQHLIEWVRLISNLDTFITGEHQTYYIQIAVPKKGQRRADVGHLERYSSEDTGSTDDDTEYTFNIWKSEWKYVENFLKQYEIGYRVLKGQA